MRRGAAVLAVSLCASAAVSCGGTEPPRTYLWQAVQTELPGAMLSIWGTSSRDVYAVGSDSRDGLGPMVLHFDGASWTRMDTTLGEGDLWWVYGPSSDAIFMGGSGGRILRYNPQTRAFTRMTTPGTETIFGIWGASENDVWAVGGDVVPNATRAGVIWHWDGTAWTDVALPNNAGSRYTLFKVWGSAANDVWVVGNNSETLHFNGTAWTEAQVPDALRGQLLTIHGQGTHRYAVGGSASGLLLEDTGNGWQQVRVAGDGLPRLAGVFAPANANPIAVGSNGTVVHRGPNGWQYVAPGPQTSFDFHSVWVDPDGGVWAVGGQTVSTPLGHGMIWHFGERVNAGTLANDPALLSCPSTAGSICTYAGLTDPGFNGDGHHRRQSTLYWPVDLEFNSTGQAYILDWNNHRIRRVRSDETLETVVGTEIPGDGDPLMADLHAPGALGTTVALNHPTDLLFHPTDGTLMVCAWHNHKIRQLDVQSGMVTVAIGRGPGASGDGGPAAMALLKQPSKFAYDSAGNFYIFDQGNLRIRRVGTDGNITTVAGNGMRGFAGDGGDPLMAQFSLQGGENPEPEGGLAVDAQNRLWIADTENNRIRMIDFTANTITTVAGDGMGAYAGDGGPAASARIYSPRDIEFGPDGNLYIADTGNHCIRMIETATMNMRHVAGQCGQHGYGGDRGPATAALFYRPFGIAFDPQGNLFVADTYNNRIRRIQH